MADVACVGSASNPPVCVAPASSLSMAFRYRVKAASPLKALGSLAWMVCRSGGGGVNPPMREEKEEETSLATVLPAPDRPRGVGGKGCIVTAKGMEEARGAWAGTEGPGGGACKGRRGDGGGSRERREGDEAGDRHWPGEKSFMPKEALSLGGDDGMLMRGWVPV